VIRRIAVVAALALGLSLLVPGTAQAAPASMSFQTVSASKTCLLVLWQNTYTKVRYKERVCPGQWKGEGSGGGNSTSEPVAFLPPTGYRVEWWVNGGRHVTADARRGSFWVPVHPGNLVKGRWHVYARASR